jgi:bifunctional enzyme CysN/CysC
MSKAEDAPPPNTDLAFAGPKDFEAIADRIVEELKRQGVLAQAIGAKQQFHYSI